MRTLSSLCWLAWGAALVTGCGGDEPDVAGPDTVTVEGENSAPRADPFCSLAKGMSWTIKSVRRGKEESAGELINFFRFKITAWDGKRGTLVMTTLDQRKRETGHKKTIDLPRGLGRLPPKGSTEEVVDVAGRSFPCRVMEIEGARSWVSTEFPAVVVKSTFETDQASVSQTLVKFEN